MLCLPKQIADNFLLAVRNGDLNPEDLAKMSSEERQKLIERFVGTVSAPKVNAMFEQRLLMKNQTEAMINWVKDVANLRPAVKRDLLSRIEKLDKVLTPDEERAFLGDLVSEKIGTRTTVEDARKIAELSKLFQEAKANPDSGLEYGASKVALNNYINDLKIKNESRTALERLKDFKENPAGEGLKAVEDLAGFAKGIKASLDNSAIFRQGWRTLFTNPQIWAKNAMQSFVDIKDQLSGKNVVDAIKAEIESRPNGRNGLYQALKLDVGDLEEAYPTTLPEKIPLFGRLYKSSEAAYTGFLYRMRADIADKMIDLAKDQGVDLTVKAQSESIGRLVNSLTGRGNLGPLERVGKTINTVFFSPKMLKSHIDFFTQPIGIDVAGNVVSEFAAKEAAKNVLKVVTGIASILGTAYAINPDSVELDSRSADFGKIRVGDTRFDVSGGMSPLVVLATRLMKQSTKSSTTGKVTKINEKNKDGSPKFGGKTGGDVIFDFFENKYSPMFSVLKQLRDQQTFEGDKPTAGSLASDLFVPLTPQNIYDASKNEEAANLLLIGISESLGISTATYDRKH